jgi:two-component system sensor histidine kinase DesK
MLDRMSLDERRVDLSQVWASLASRGARKWYLGSIFGLGWLVIGVFQQGIADLPVGERALMIGYTVVFGLAFAIAAPVSWVLSQRWRLVPALCLFALSFGFVPAFGWGLAEFWTFVGVAAGMGQVAIRSLVVFVISLGALALLFEYLDDPTSGAIGAVPAVTISISLFMGAFGRQILLINQLRATQDELAKLAVAEERSRVGRDMHDILGHSLTVITVKAELAGRMIDVDPSRAAAEIADVEQLARGALADVRSTVAGYRGVNIASELAGARSALESAGIRAQLPTTVDVVPADDRELFGWVVREGVTNVVRHSGALRARVSLGRDFVEVADDGKGPAAGDELGARGTGLDGLAERAERAGARLRIGRAPEGGYLLRVAR